MQIKFLAGWNEGSNNFFWYSEVFDDIHITRRQDASKFFWDDSVEYQFNYNHEAAEDQNQGDMVTSVDYNYAMPPVDGAWEFYRPLRESAVAGLRLQVDRGGLGASTARSSVPAPTTTSSRSRRSRRCRSARTPRRARWSRAISRRA